MPAVTSIKKLPLPKCNFELEWGAVTIGFTDVTGLDLTTATVAQRGSKRKASKIKMPGMHKLSNITLKRGMVLKGAPRSPGEEISSFS